MTQAEVKKLFKYDRRGFLSYRVRPHQSKNKKDPRAATPSRGRYVVRVSDVLYMEHRLVFLCHKGFLPDEVDHKNQDPSDNRISNLRAASFHQNQWNRKKTKRNTSGFKGVHFCKRTNSWRSSAMRNRTVYRFGRFDTAEEAARAYDAFIKQNDGPFASLNYDDTKTRRA